MTTDTLQPQRIDEKIKNMSIHVEKLAKKIQDTSSLNGVRGGNTIPLSKSLQKRGLELTRSDDFLNGSKDLFDLLENQKPANGARKSEAEKKAATSYIDKALGLINKATSIIERAENRIAEQNLRIQNLEGMSMIDELTGLLNRQGFLKTFAREINRTERRQEKGGILVLIDLDNFETLHKQYGSRTAQKAIFVTAKLLNKEIRDMDAAARTDKDEFILMLADTTPDEAAERIQRLALRLNSLSFSDKGVDLAIHASISLKAYKSGDTLSRLAGIAEIGAAQQQEQNEGITL